MLQDQRLLYDLRGDNSLKIVFLLSEKGSSVKGKNLIPMDNRSLRNGVLQERILLYDFRGIDTLSGVITVKIGWPPF